MFQVEAKSSTAPDAASTQFAGEPCYTSTLAPGVTVPPQMVVDIQQASTTSSTQFSPVVLFENDVDIDDDDDDTMVYVVRLWYISGLIMSIQLKIYLFNTPVFV